MPSDLLKVPKSLRKVTLWVHPEGRVSGSLFLHKQSTSRAGEQEPLEVMNEPGSFLVVQREDPHELRFYNKSSIIRLEHDQEDEETFPEVKPIPCRLSMMDGSLITGYIRVPLPPDRSRLFDYLNKTDQRFIKLSMEDGLVYLVNKSYIIHAVDLDDRA